MMVLTNCANCKMIVRLATLSLINPWVDEDGGVRCPDGSGAQHHVTGKALFLQIVSDAMQAIDRATHDSSSPQEYAQAITEAMHEILAPGEEPGRHH